MAELKESELTKIKNLKRVTTAQNVSICAGAVITGATVSGSIGYISQVFNNDMDKKAQAKLDDLVSIGASEKEIEKVVRKAKIRKTLVNVGSVALEFCAGYTIGVAGGTIMKLNTKNKNAEISKIYAKANAKESK